MPLRRWLPSVSDADRPATHERQALAAQLVEYLTSQISEPQHAAALMRHVARFHRLSPREQCVQLPHLYLLLEHYLVGLDPHQQLTPAALRAVLLSSYAPLLEEPGFSLIIQPPARQEILLCSYLLEGIAQSAQALVGNARDSLLPELQRWLQTVPDQAFLPVPFAWGEALPQTDQGWLALFQHIARECHAHITLILGDIRTAQIVEQEYLTLAAAYSLLSTFPVVLDLLPETLYDPRMISELSRYQVEQVLRNQIVQLQTANAELTQQNAELEHVREELRCTRETVFATNAQLASVLNAVDEGIMTISETGVIEMINQEALNLWGVAAHELIGHDVRVLLPDEDQTQPSGGIIQKFRRLMSQTSGGRIELTSVKKDGARFLAELRIVETQIESRRLFIAMVRDISDRQRIEDERLRISKLESISLLAGGIAHDFNNIMTGIMGYLSFAKLDLSQDNPIYERLTEVEHATLEAKELTNQLLVFARGGTPIKELISIGELTRDAATFVLRGSNVRCTWDLSDNLWWVEANAGQLTQVIHNLVINAIQAMADNSGGELMIAGENMIFSEPTELQGRILEPGFYIKLSVTDQGPGIPPAQLEKIFDPYFTTKSSGTGLGLTTTHTIVTRHNGALTVRSIIGSGTTFALYLPASATNDEPQKSPDAAHRPLVDEGQKQHILVMDDDRVIRELTARSLTRFGYLVTAVDDGARAVESYTRALNEGHPYDAVIMDLTVPGGMGGKDATEALLAFDPHAKILVSSGYSNDPILANHEHYGFCGMLVKPYRVEELAAAVRQILEQPPSST